MPRRSATPLHVQPGDDESFLVLSGEIDFYVDGDAVRAGPNDARHIPRGTPHAFQVASPSARLLVARHARGPRAVLPGGGRHRRRTGWLPTSSA
jgi:quercetin dioxygenase-like cupin family protein